MKTVFEIVVLLCVLVTLGKADEATSLGNEIISDINSGRADYVEVLLTPDKALYRASLNEERLEKCATTVMIKNFSKNKTTPLLLTVLKTLRLNPKTENLDLRYGCKFFDSKGVVIHTLYIDNLVTLGKCDGKAVIISKEIKDCIEAIIKEKP
jgi:hypothetical protein